MDIETNVNKTIYYKKILKEFNELKEEFYVNIKKFKALKHNDPQRSIILDNNDAIIEKVNKLIG